MSRISASTSICMIIGDPVSSSLSPRMHNAAYAAAGLDSRFVFVGARVAREELPRALEGARALGIRGISCTMPHKQAVIPLLDRVDEVAMRIGAVNTIVNENGKLEGYNTDWRGVTVPLLELTPLTGKTAAVIGAGGAARAAAFGLAECGARVIVFNRTKEKAEALARELGCEARSLDEIDRVREAEVVVHATPAGMHPDAGSSVLAPDQIDRRQIIYDTVYSPHETRLIRNARAAGASVVHGIEMLLHQGVVQYELYTGQKAPVGAMRAALEESLREKR